MPSILSDDDKDTVKRFVPKQTNKIHAVAVAKLYVAYPSRQKWTNTGIQGAIVLANDLVGHTYWLKMVDISPASRGVIWDQEIFDSWSYNHDRTFFHTFEMEECLAGLSFVDEKEAKQFKKKMDDREKNASKQTKATHFGGGGHQEKKHGFLGGLFGSRHSSAPTPPESPRNTLPPAPANHSPSMSAFSLNGRQASEFSLLDDFDPLWREHFGQDLTDKGLTDEFIKDNQEFIVEFLREQQAQTRAQEAQAARPAPPPPPPANGDDSRGSRPPPPPPPPGGRAEAPSPPTGAKAPPPPAPRRSGKAESETTQAPEPPAGPPRPKFNAPPALPDAGRFARVEQQAKAAPAPPPRGPNPGPPPPPRAAPKAHAEDNQNHKFNVPPPLPPPSQRSVPPPPARGGVPPPPPPRSNAAPTPAVGAPPPLPPKVPMGGPPPLPPTNNRPVPVPPPSAPQLPPAAPPLPPPNNTNVPPPPPPLPPPSTSGPPPPPPPPPPPSMGGPPPPPPPPPSMGGPPPPPPPPPSMGGPPPPPPNRDSGYSSGPPPGAPAGRGAMLSDIQKAGGIGALKKVDRTQIRDRSAAQVGDSDSSAPPGPSTAPGGAPNMANALAAALQKRKEKVSRSDDEDDDDDW